MVFLIRLINYLANILMIIVIVDVVLSYFMSPWHPFRQALDRIVEPMLAPIRRVLPSVGGLDFSPIVLLILIQLITGLLTNILRSV